MTSAAPHCRVWACSYLNMGMMTVSTFFPTPSPDVSTDTSLRVPSAASCTSCINRPRMKSPDHQKVAKIKRQPRVKERQYVARHRILQRLKGIVIIRAPASFHGLLQSMPKALLTQEGGASLTFRLTLPTP